MKSLSDYHFEKMLEHENRARAALISGNFIRYDCNCVCQDYHEAWYILLNLEKFVQPDNQTVFAGESL